MLETTVCAALAIPFTCETFEVDVFIGVFIFGLYH